MSCYMVYGFCAAFLLVANEEYSAILCHKIIPVLYLVLYTSFTRIIQTMHSLLLQGVATQLDKNKNTVRAK